MSQGLGVLTITVNVRELADVEEALRQPVPSRSHLRLSSGERDRRSERQEEDHRELVTKQPRERRLKEKWLSVTRVTQRN